MSDTDTTTTTATQDQATETGATPADLGDSGKKALDSERKARRDAEKAAAALQAKLDEIQKAQMSDLEKAQASAREFQEAAERSASEALRWRIAAKYGISDDDAQTFLTGTDEESLQRQAERLAAMQQRPSGPTTPLPDRSQGGSGSSLALNDSDGLENALRSKLGM